MKQETIKSISTFPVNNLFAVYEYDGKRFKGKILSILVCLLSDDTVNFKLITTSEITTGFMINLLNDELNDVQNFIGIIDENEHWVEVTELNNSFCKV